VERCDASDAGLIDERTDERGKGFSERGTGKYLRYPQHDALSLTKHEWFDDNFRRVHNNTLGVSITE
jgi:hypothetical protein